MSELQKKDLHKLIERLRTTHAISPQEETLLRSSFRNLETDLDIQKRRVHHRITVASQWQTEQTELHREIALLKIETTKLEAQLDKKMRQIRRLQTELKANEDVINHLQKDQHHLQSSQHHLQEEREVLAKCDFFPITSNPSDPVYAKPADFLSAVVDAAKTSIDILVHTFTNPLLAEKLAQAAKRGVAVRVVYDGAWLDTVLAGSAASVSRASWNRVYRKWKHSTLEHAGFIEAGSSRARRRPFNHNLIVVDGAVMLTGTWLFADEHGLEASTSFVILTAQSPRDNPCILQAMDTVERVWIQRIEPRYPAEFTVVKLPELKRGATIM
eukprot:m.2151 g.2151  ORF g.2151 m.2151 type:complete len:328 (-) comp3066_c0_seq1:72-1055(-)